MSDEQRGDSLADQAAAWVPPWDRPRPTTAEDTPTPPDESAAPPDTSGGPDPVELASDEVGPGEPQHAEAASDEVASAEPDRGAANRVGSAGPDLGAVTKGTPGESGDAGDVPRRQQAGRRRVTAAPEPAPELSDTELRGALEAILLVVDEPVSELVLAQVLEQPAERVGPMLDEIAAGYTAAGHGFELRRAAGGWRLYTRPEYATYVERFVLDGQSVRLTQAALETLAVVAYKQPVTRSRISAIRGVNCDGVIRTLVTRGLIEECGTETDSGAFLYKTTTLFLEKLGLNTVNELPPLAPFLPDDVEELADATR
ncbi:SMC-Scp complex subunit ScpB [Micromonospora vinacea]|uniref:SMC-Scp complex subunit ScpB n=1 Tax=Micromonospora vinacea TaxID=709878 RepID=UPI003D92611B